ncbi:MAG: Asp-tRNA(Asn)/Glu-tRNA(Gln) amidotransferase subunit GatB, partial [Anaerolineae bacterium]
TKPDFASVEEVREYVLKLRRILRYLGVSSGNMEEGAMRFEANVSLHPVGTAELGTRIEIKNLNSFRALLRSLEYEISRQEQVLCHGGEIHRETRGWDDERGVTFVQRSKEFADDYRYFPEPDLPPLEVSREWVEEIRARMPQLPDERYCRFTSEYGLSAYDAGLLTDDRPIADYFEQAVAIAKAKGIQPKAIANWITSELFRLLRATGVEPTAIRVPPAQLVELIALLHENRITMTSAKHVLEVMFHTGKPAQDIVAEEGLLQIADADQIAPIVEEVIRANPEAVAQYKRGKETVLRFLVGQVMRATKGKADPNVTAELIRKKLSV